MEEVMVTAQWSGSYPCLCYGVWTLIVNGEDVSNKIPSGLRKSSMNTYGTYSRWYFNDNWIEHFEDYTDGLHLNEWIAENDDWLNEITTDY